MVTKYRRNVSAVAYLGLAVITLVLGLVARAFILFEMAAVLVCFAFLRVYQYTAFDGDELVQAALRGPIRIRSADITTARYVTLAVLGPKSFTAWAYVFGTSTTGLVALPRFGYTPTARRRLFSDLHQWLHGSTVDLDPRAHALLKRLQQG